MATIRRILPTTNAALALLAWRNRHAVVDTARFAARSVDRLRAGDRSDVISEARLRARLLADPHARNAPGLKLEVRDGVAHFAGAPDQATLRAVYAAAEATPGVARIRDETSGRRRFPRRR